MQIPDSAATNSPDKQTFNRLGHSPAFYHLKSGNKHGSFSGIPSVSAGNSRHCARLKKQYLKQASADFSFSKEVLEQWGLPSLPYSQYNFDHIYSTENIISKGTEFQARKAPKFSPQYSPSLMDLPSLPALQPITKEIKAPKKYKPKQSRKGSSPGDALARSFSCLATEIMESHSTTVLPTTDWQADQREQWLKPTEKETRGWENIVLKKLSKRTARWIQNKRVPLAAGSSSKWQNFLRHQYDWSHIKDELSSASDLELVAQLEAEETAELEGVDIGTSTLEGNKPELLLPVYFRIPAYLPFKKKSEMTMGTNKTAEDIVTERSLFRVPPVQKFQQINPRAGKYAYSTDNVFEQEIYFDLIHIIHQSGIKDDEIVLENLNHYCKHLPKAFPKGPEEWNYEPQPQRVSRPTRGAFRWTALPTPAKDLLQLSQETAGSKTRREKKDFLQKVEQNVCWEIQVLRNMLKEWKNAWFLTIRWQEATVEGLLRNLKNVQDDVKIDAIITCASAAVERPRFEIIVEDSDSEEVIDNLSIDEIPKELQPLIKEALTHKKTHVRMAAALCQYAIRAHDSQAQNIMQDALAKGNDADSWAAAQCLALDGVASFAVVKRILFQLFYKKDKETEEQSCLLLSHLSNKTSMIHTLLAVELNSCQWEDRIVACRALSRISGRSVSQDLKNKLVQLMWNDWNWGVRQAAAQTLGRMKLGKEVHDKIRTMLGQGNSQDRVDALSLIGWLKLMTVKLLPDFLNCFNDDFVAVRREACLAAGALKIKDKMVYDSLMKLVHSDPYWKIKAFAIRALGMIGQVSPQLIELLLWAIHYEDEPGVRLEACRSIIALQLQGDQLRDIFLDVLLLESHEAVLREINTAMKILNLKDKGNQVMLQLIKNKIAELNHRDLITNKIMKTEEIAETIRQQTKYIYQSHPKKHQPSHLVDFFKDAFQDSEVPFTLSASDTCDMEKALAPLPTSPIPSAYSKSPIFEKKIPKRLILNKRVKTIREKRIALGPFHKTKKPSKI
ncbi:HEAT repeat-containing protein 4 [Antechinus flavipes]|uniref:HEAT repeat-containing protein 4 n=1 Tax=Antechinus flavipes TaxID=38775 RepID=UPI0022366DB3|nr:HEAT repeat-containing protein 4 [Antechinus flavipes]XP_051833601.1 HEAT repeat-containing protein 4 [Antechinus flavipes]